ncbi:putative uncharacterized protein DDB_G0287191 [Bombyx mandarina]|uniref:Histidine-rich glycoprotein-like n=1 Tax=Bombyx mandarina TaxID=7092 RepID=A0A6J2KHF4_BOMMA|nr:putative uncharacterized protein DDB_G0287191 [Bombyx mandarina]
MRSSVRDQGQADKRGIFGEPGGLLTPHLHHDLHHDLHHNFHHDLHHDFHHDLHHDFHHDLHHHDLHHHGHLHAPIIHDHFDHAHIHTPIIHEPLLPSTTIIKSSRLIHPVKHIIKHYNYGGW